MRLARCTIALLSLTALLAFATSLAAEESEEKKSKPAKLFSTTDTLTVTMTAPWRDITIKKNYQGSYPATIEYTDELGQAMKLPLTVERRGITRQRVCKYPPIKLRFQKEDVKGTTFRGQKSLKMVTHCDRSSRYEDYYILEMLAYRMYNLITDMSFRVRPLKITYDDPDAGRGDEERFAFLIEDDSDVADRFDLKKLRIPKLGLSQMDPKTASEFSLFQYMIGNVDWAALRGPDPEECCHNVKLIGPKPFKAGDIAYPLPYDFDSSGLVDAEYAAPPQGLPIKYVTQRLYRGYCAYNETLEPARLLFLEREQAIYDLVKSETRLDAKAQKRTIRYLDKFFDVMRDERDFEDEITEQCRR
jgi:hypothetical protein